MTEITKENLEAWITEMSKDTEPFDCEYDFQFSLAKKITSMCSNIDIGFEKKIYNDKRCRCDLVLIDKDKKNERILIELKYIYTHSPKQAEKSSLQSRASFISDYNRIVDAIDEKEEKKAEKGFVIFLTNKSAVFDNPKGEKMNNKEFVKIFHKKYSNKEYWKECPFKNEGNKPKLLIVEVNNENT